MKRGIAMWLQQMPTPPRVWRLAIAQRAGALIRLLRATAAAEPPLLLKHRVETPCHHCR
jgi:hypothetical protein